MIAFINKFLTSSSLIKKDAKHHQSATLDEPIQLAQYYGNHIPWELPVQYCASDCIESGDIVFDIGGHIGGVAVAFSKMVGVNGHVYTFEPNQDIVKHLLSNLEINNAVNVSHIPLACYSESNRLMKFYSEPSFYKAGSGLVRQLDGAKSFDVVTIAVDDFCRVNSLTPSFIKIDVEGAEIDVLRSATCLLEEKKVPIILEYQSVEQIDGDDPLIFLEKMGYQFYDVNTYNPTSAKVYSALPELPLVNVLCLHEDSRLASRYENLIKKCVFEWSSPNQETVELGNIKLEPGRYVVKVIFECPDDVIGGLAVKKNSEFLAYYEADAVHLKQHSCSSIVINLDAPQLVSIQFIKKGSYKAWIKKIEIHSIEITSL